jgi:hypothetical protein
MQPHRLPPYKIAAGDPVRVRGVSILCSLPAPAGSTQQPSSTQQHHAPSTQPRRVNPVKSRPAGRPPPRQAMMPHLPCHRATAS